MIRLPFSWSAGPVKPRRQVPPYLPISASGLTTITSSDPGKRSSRAGIVPLLTKSASMGASANFLGYMPISRMISGPSSLPMSVSPSLGWAAAVGATGAAVATAGAVVGAG